jgi:ABC-type transporter Mla MlaB component
VVRIYGPLRREDLPGLYGRACTALTSAQGKLLAVDVGAVDADAVAVDALAQLELAARRRGCRVAVQRASRELCELIELMGLAEVFLSPTSAAVRRGGKAGPYPGRT